MNKKKALLKNTLVIALGRMSTQLVSFLLLPLYTIFLSPGDYGAVDLLLNYIALLVPVLTVQLEMASFRFLVDARGSEAEKRRVISNVLHVIVPIFLLCTGLFLVLTAYVSIPHAALIILNVAAMLFANLFLQFARGIGENKQYALASVVAGVVTLLVAIVAIVFLRLGAEGVLIAAALANVVCSIYLFFALRLYRYIRFRNRDTVLQKQLLAYSLPLVPHSISWWAINIADRTIIAIVIGVAANGIYAVANKYAAIFTTVAFIFGMSWTEAASLHINAKDRDRFFSQTINASIKVFGALALMLIAYIPLVFPFIIDAAFAEAYLYIPLLVIGAFLSAVVGLYNAIYVAKKLTRQVATTSLVAAAISIALNLALISFIGIYAAALSTIIAYLAMVLYRHHDSKKYVTISYEPHLPIKLLVFCAVVLVAYYCNVTISNILSAVVVTIIAGVLNKPLVRLVKNKIITIYHKKQK
jgi:O-antigen/teichoic acid export membrane protein